MDSLDRRTTLSRAVISAWQNGEPDGMLMRELEKECAVKCPHCGSDRMIPYTFKPPKKTKGTHECEPDCTVNGFLCLNCRMVKG
jgi:hypothetical protein